MNFIKNIINNNIDEYTHMKFVRFSKGTFVREPFKIKVMGTGIQIKSGFEYLDVLFGLIAKLNQDTAFISGTMVTKKDIKEELASLEIEPEKITGKKYTLKEDMDADKLRNFFDRFKNTFLLLSIKGKDYSFSCKKSVPKPGKPVEDFCSAKFKKSDLEVLKDEFLFDSKDDFKEAVINHIYTIIGFEIPKEADTPEKMRLMAKRVGTLTREVILDGKVSKSEFDLKV